MFLCTILILQSINVTIFFQVMLFIVLHLQWRDDNIERMQIIDIHLCIWIE